ncbi:hypothetical protein D5F11_010290 [Siminovitchia terrae]|uniref:Uncharacterized protein n=1 Tax=Siminovitchia terrae TaxID=1914933 RepID=A0A429X8S3_SIMTE|nr:hypothetical protein [Siminovitchia terrae]RST59792.1 hypothetical protein D5F11_010290 [Siminovitchia terrae]
MSDKCTIAACSMNLPHLKHPFLKWGFPNQSTKSFQQDRRVTPIFCGKPQEFILPTTLGNSLSLDNRVGTDHLLLPALRQSVDTLYGLGENQVP